MKLLYCLLFLLTPVLTRATNYFIDPSSHAEEKGTIEAPWKSFDLLYTIMDKLAPGDTIHLKRGEIFFGPLDLQCSGTAAAPIVFIPYGTARAKPVILVKAKAGEAAKQFAIRILKSSYVKLEGIAITDDHTDPEDHHVMANIKIAIAIQESNFTSIHNCEISLVGIGINILGNNNFIDRCNIMNLRMMLNTQDKPYDDYGANGIVLSGADNTISNCNFSGCWANSYDFEFDGGAIEMADSVCNRNRITHNTAFNCNGFMEFGSNVGGTISGNIVEGNLVLNCSDLLYINNDGPFKVSVQQLELLNNIFIQTYPQFTKPASMIALKTSSAEKNIIVLRNNIFWLPTPIDVVRPAQFEGESLQHANNIFYLNGGKLNFNPAASEKILNPSSQELQQLLRKNSLHNVDIYPFILLVKFWELMI